MSIWSRYYNKTVKERVDILQKECDHVTPDLANKLDKLLRGCLFNNDAADIMIENCIGTFGLPLGVVPNVLINSKPYNLFFAVEEPSVIAANSASHKTFKSVGGLTATYSGNIMIGQIQILFNQNGNNGNMTININEEYLSTKYKYIDFLKENEAKYIKIGNEEFCESMVKRGGGIQRLEYRIVNPRNNYNQQELERKKRNSYIVIHVIVDVCEAMGANTINTICEGLSTIILKDLQTFNTKTQRKDEIENKENTDDDNNDGDVSIELGLRILSNLCVNRLAKCELCIPVSKLTHKGVSGDIVAEKILNAYYFALDDEYRAVTNNKGIMNGIDSVCIALGQDYRAIESAAHCYTTIKNGFYGPMAHYSIQEKQIDNINNIDNINPNSKQICLIASLELPMAVASKGGSLNSNPICKLLLKLMIGLQKNRNPDINPCTAQEIAQCLVCVGLAQNFAAMRALALEGIQKGHMKLHAKNITISAGVPKHLVNHVVNQMIQEKQRISVSSAKNIFQKTQQLEQNTKSKEDVATSETKTYPISFDWFGVSLVVVVFALIVYEFLV